MRGGPVKSEDGTGIKEGRGRSKESAASRRSTSRPQARNKSATRAGLHAREPTVQTESTRDFSDFIRSTGPDKEPQTLVPALTTRNQTSPQSATPVSPASRNQTSLQSATPVSSASRNQSTSSQPGTLDGSSSNVPAMPSPLSDSKNARSKPRSSLQAREATANADSNGDLIDFIRNGPNEKGANRIPVTVAPWALRNDDHDGEEEHENISQRNRAGRISEVALELGLQRGKTPSTSTAGSVGPQSFMTQSTVNSRAPLISSGASNTQHLSQPAYSAQTPRLGIPSALAGPSKDISGGKTRYRNKDPYAIDFSDDEDDLLTALPPKIKPDEGLADFLRNSEVPATNGPPTLTTSTKAMDQARIALQERAQRQSPTVAGKPQFAPSATSPASAAPASSNRPGTSKPATYEPSVAESSRTNGSAATIRPAQIRSHISAGDGMGQAAKPRAGPKMEVRAAGGAPRSARMNAMHDTSTGDLADFLRSSGPPDERPAARGAIGGGAPAPVVGAGGGGGKDKKGSSKTPKFWQRKRYVDMP